MINFDLMADELKRDEGFSGIAYQCTAGKITVGYGHNIQDNPIPEVIAERLLQHDITRAVEQCEQWAWFYPLSDVRQRVIINMVFNIGASGVGKFKNMIQALAECDYEKAADEMLDSKWARQVTLRAERLALMMRQG